MTEGDTTISLADQINKENANTREPTSEEENAALSLLPPRSKRARIAVADSPSSVQSGTPSSTASTPYNIPKKLNSQVWAKEVRPTELEDDEIFDELERYRLKIFILPNYKIFLQRRGFKSSTEGERKSSSFQKAGHGDEQG